MNREIVRYELVMSSNLSRFQSEINKQLNRGFSLYGETFIDRKDAYSSTYNQVTVKYQDTPVNPDIE